MLVLWAELGSSARASSAGLVSLFVLNSISHLPPLRDLSQSPGPHLLWQVSFPPLFVTFQQLWIILVRHAWVGCKWTWTCGDQRQPQVQSGHHLPPLKPGLRLAGNSPMIRAWLAPPSQSLAWVSRPNIFMRVLGTLT